MNAHGSVQHDVDGISTTEQQALFELQGYGSQLNYDQNIVSVPLQEREDEYLNHLMREIRQFGWNVQFGVL